MYSLTISLVLPLIFCQIYSCQISSIRLEPKFAILNATTSSTMKFLCSKKQDETLEFEISLSPNISKDDVEISVKYLDRTTVEINMQSFDYIGAFQLICTLKEKQNSIARSDILIGKSPGSLMRIKRCTVYNDEYIECTIMAPVMVQAMMNGLSNEIDFLELPFYSRPRIYRRNPKLVAIDSLNQTLTYRWYPEFVGYFPSKLKMNISATIQHFGTSTYRMDMTPIFEISSNFNVTNLTSTTFQIEFDHRKSSFLTTCRGNITKEQNFDSDEVETRMLGESNNTIIYANDLSPNTEYRLCFHCRREKQYETISSHICHRYKTAGSSSWFWLVNASVIIGCLILICIGILLWKKLNWSQVKRKFGRLSFEKKPEHIIITNANPSPLILPMITENEEEMMMNYLK
ncbi:hypothetical protein I4U23_008831 [Adineta vaga]|nr:hypothetical protein I4U23_008831 [Adineta vaga]